MKKRKVRKEGGEKRYERMMEGRRKGEKVEWRQEMKGRNKKKWKEEIRNRWRKIIWTGNTDRVNGRVKGKYREE